MESNIKINVFTIEWISVQISEELSRKMAKSPRFKQGERLMERLLGLVYC